MVSPITLSLFIEYKERGVPLGRSTLSLHDETKSRLFRTRGKMELKDGKKRTLEDVINELIDNFEEEKSA